MAGELKRIVKCPKCQSELPFHSNANAGDYSFCFSCGSINVYLKNTQLKVAEVQDILEMSAIDFRNAKQFNQTTRKLREGLNRLNS